MYKFTPISEKFINFPHILVQFTFLLKLRLFSPYFDHDAFTRTGCPRMGGDLGDWGDGPSKIWGGGRSMHPSPQYLEK